MAKPKPPVEAVVDTAVHPLFARLREEAGFAEFSGATLETMLEAASRWSSLRRIRT